jgi:hypothetical protein
MCPEYGQIYRLCVGCWKDKQAIYMLSNMHIPPVEENFKECRKAVKPLVTEDYIIHMGYVDLSDRVANSCSIAKEPGNGQK